MCGICGSSGDAEGRAVAAMNAAMVHRGPDDEGTYADERTGFALGARRLSIIDVGGRAPAAEQRGRHGLGRPERGDLQPPGAASSDSGSAGIGSPRHATRRCWCTSTRTSETRSCTRSRACSRSRSGTPRGSGCWSARDRFGEKPLFYAEREPGALVFASELRRAAVGGRDAVSSSTRPQWTASSSMATAGARLDGQGGAAAARRVHADVERGGATRRAAALLVTAPARSPRWCRRSGELVGRDEATAGERRFGAA